MFEVQIDILAGVEKRMGTRYKTMDGNPKFLAETHRLMEGQPHSRGQYGFESHCVYCALTPYGVSIGLCLMGRITMGS